MGVNTNGKIVNKYIVLPKKILSTPESDAMIARLRKINNHIRGARKYKLHGWVRGILLSDSDTLTNIYSHIHAILVAFIKRRIHVHSDEYFYLMKCGNDILNTACVDSPNKSQYTQYKYMMAVYFLNYIKKLTTYDFRNNYVCNINEYVKTCYNNILMDTNTDTHIEMRHIYMNLKKIIYVKKYLYSINSKVFSIMLDYWQHNDYNITEIPASYITKDAVLTDNELEMLEVTQKQMNSLFGTYGAGKKDVVIQELNDEPDTDDTTVVGEPELVDQPTNTAQHDTDESQDEPEEGIYPDEYE